MSNFIFNRIRTRPKLTKLPDLYKILEIYFYENMIKMGEKFFCLRRIFCIICKISICITLHFLHYFWFPLLYSTFIIYNFAFLYTWKYPLDNYFYERYVHIWDKVMWSWHPAFFCRNRLKHMRGRYKSISN
jgi:hypothetical protein